eukprot:4363410-Pyramimonas_sp.AAC.1
MNDRPYHDGSGVVQANSPQGQTHFRFLCTEEPKVQLPAIFIGDRWVNAPECLETGLGIKTTPVWTWARARSWARRPGHRSSELWCSADRLERLWRYQF